MIYETKILVKKQVSVKDKDPLLPLQHALAICGFGKFHYKLWLATLTSIFASTMVTTTSSYLLPNAECDLNMSIMQKGLLNAAPFAGVFIASLLCCFFVDAFGCKVFLVGGHAAIFIFTVLEASSQSYWSLLFLKVLEGGSLILCVVANLTLVADFTSKELRNRIGMFIVSFVPLALIGGAIIALGLLPHQEWQFVIWKGYFELRAWNIYLYVCSVFSLIATVLYYILPDSLTYLILQGKEGEALEILKNVYSENTGCDRDAFPIKTLGSSGILAAGKISLKRRGKLYLKKFNQLFQRPIVYKLIIFSWLSFVSHLVLTTVRLWYPQISTIVGDFQKQYHTTDRFCIILNNYTQNLNIVSNTTSDVCVPTSTEIDTYINIIIVSITSFFAINVTGYLTEYFGQKLLMMHLFIFCGLSTGLLYLCTETFEIALVVSLMCGMLQAAMGLQKTALTNLFPVTLKALGLSILIMWSRFGAFLGNMLFPVLLQIDCFVPFFTLSVLVFCASAVVCLI